MMCTRNCSRDSASSLDNTLSAMQSAFALAVVAEVSVLVSLESPVTVVVTDSVAEVSVADTVVSVSETVVSVSESVV